MTHDKSMEDRTLPLAVLGVIQTEDREGIEGGGLVFHSVYPEIGVGARIIIVKSWIGALQEHLKACEYEQAMGEEEDASERH